MLSGRFAEMRWRAARAVRPTLGSRPAEVAATTARACASRALASASVGLCASACACSASSRASPKRCHHGPLRRRVVRCAFAPRRFQLPGRRRLDRRPHVVGTDDAAAEQRQHCRDGSVDAAARVAARAPPCRRRGAAGRRRAVTAAPWRRAGPGARRSLQRLRPPRDGVAFAERVGRIDDQPLARSDAVGDLDRLAEIAAERDRLQVHAVGRVDAATRVPSLRNISTLVGTTSVPLARSGRSTWT